MKLLPTILIHAALLLPFGTVSGHSAESTGLNWPDDHLLPTFSPAASVIDCIDIDDVSDAEVDLFASLEGIVNRTQPRLGLIQDRQEEGRFVWLKLHQLSHQPIDGYAAIAKYKSSVTGLVVTDPDQPATLNLATTIAGLNDELICDPSLLATLTNAPYQLSIKDDLRGRFSSEPQVYQYLYDHYWAQCPHRVIAGLSPGIHGFLRDYMVALKSAVVWCAPHPGSTNEAILKEFISEMKPAHGVYMGWWPSEDDGLKWIGQFGIPVLASDFFNNATLFGGVAQPLEVPAIPPPPPLENKVYVSLIISDGDNVQYMQHYLRINWSNPARGRVPIGWTVSPLAVDLDPGLLNYYWRTATTNDCLVSGPSGSGYARINFWDRPADLAEFTRMSDSYLRRSGLRVITIWNQITDDVANSFATNCPTLLGLTDQTGGSYQTVHLGLPSIGLGRASYSSSIDAMRDSIIHASRKWNGTAPRFLGVQGNGWNISPEDCEKIADSLDKNKFVVVRPDQLFMLYRQSLAAAAAGKATAGPN